VGHSYSAKRSFLALSAGIRKEKTQVDPNSYLKKRKRR
jgi:hypothetical protein